MQNYYDAPKPVSLQPFKTLKIVFMVVAIVFSAFMLYFGWMFYITSDPFGEPAPARLFSPLMLIGLFSYSIQAIACWILFFVFNGKYKERVEHNRSLGIYNE